MDHTPDFLRNFKVISVSCLVINVTFSPQCIKCIEGLYRTDYLEPPSL